MRKLIFGFLIAAGLVFGQTHETLGIAPDGGSGLYVCESASASASAYTCTASPAITSLSNGLTIAFKADVENSGTATLNVSSLGAASIKKQCGANDPSAGDLTAGAWLLLVYDGTNWNIQNDACDPGIPSLTWDNQGSSTVTSVNGAEMLSSGAGTGLTARYTTAPSTPYTLTVQIIISPINVATNVTKWVGLAFRESGTGKLTVSMFAIGNINNSFTQISNYTNSSTLSGDIFGPSINSVWDGVVGHNAVSYNCYRARDDGTNLSFWYSADCLNFFQLGSNIGRTSFMAGGPDQIAWQAALSTSAYYTLTKWTVTSP